jgi:hypothetical protein
VLVAVLPSIPAALRLPFTLVIGFIVVLRAGAAPAMSFSWRCVFA